MDQIVLTLFELDRSISSAAYFLPAFEVRNLTAAVRELRGQLQNIQQAKLPRVPFAFSDSSVLVQVDDPQQQVCDLSEAPPHSACESFNALQACFIIVIELQRGCQGNTTTSRPLTVALWMFMSFEQQHAHDCQTAYKQPNALAGLEAARGPGSWRKSAKCTGTHT